MACTEIFLLTNLQVINNYKCPVIQWKFIHIYKIDWKQIIYIFITIAKITKYI